MNELLNHIFKSSAQLLPELILLAGMVILTGIVAFTPKPTTTTTFNKLLWLTIVLLFLTALAVYPRTFVADTFLFSKSLILSSKTAYFQLLIIAVGIVSLLHAKAVKFTTAAEYHILILGVTFGLLLMSMAHQFMVMYVALELVSICSYILIAIQKKGINFEAGIKYLSVGAIISAVMLYGISLLYGISGSFYFDEIAFGIGNQETQIASVVILLAIAGLLFKMSAAPFHIWAPDAYEKAPTPALSFLSVGPKIAAFIVIERLLTSVEFDLSLVLAVIILSSITMGNFAALWQKDVKRLLAYSGIAHAGFILIGLLSYSESGLQGSEYYLMAYAFINPAAFLLIDLLKQKSSSYTLESFAGLGSRYVVLGVFAIIIMISMVGIPPTAGFTAKFMVFSSLIPAIGEGNTLFTVVLIFGVLNTAISLFYYLRIPYYLFLKEPDTLPQPIPTSKWALVLLAFLVAGVVILFFVPQLVTFF